MEDYEKIELRSEKVRKIIGQIPPRIIRTGTSILFLVFLLLLAGSYYIPYPEMVEVNVILKQGKPGDESSFYAEALIPYAYLLKIQKGQSAVISIDGYEKNTYGIINGKVIYTNHDVITRSGKAYFRVCIRFANGMTTTQNKKIEFHTRMQGEAQIIYSKNTLFNRIIDQGKR